MASLQDFRVDALALVRLSVMGDSALNPPVGDLRSHYLDDVVPVLPGQKGFQLRVSHAGYDNTDSNSRIQLATCVVEVIRGLHLREFVEDEELYVSDEMLFSQARLLDPSLWRALDSVEGGELPDPELTEDAGREGNIIRYTVTLTDVPLKPT